MNIPTRFSALLFSAAFAMSLIVSCAPQTCEEKATAQEESIAKAFALRYDKAAMNHDAIQKQFEAYFLDNGYVQPNDNKGELYHQILTFLATTDQRFPALADRETVLKQASKFGIDETGLQTFDQLAPLTDGYVAYATGCPDDQQSLLYIFGATVRAIQKKSQVRPSTFANALVQRVTPEQLENELYREIIAQYHLFAFALWIR